MTATGGTADDDQARVGRDPLAFPHVGASDNSDASRSEASTRASLFTSANSTAESTAAQPTPPVATQRVGAGTRHNARLRLLVAGVATLVVVALVGAVLFLATPRTGAPSATARYVPADTAAYVEIRLDMPGDQRTNLATFMTHFPGFADPANFQQKLDESLNKLVASKNAGLDWTNDVKPWFGGQVAVFGNPSGAAGGSSACPTPGTCGDTTATQSQSVFIVTVSDRQKLQVAIDAHLGAAHVATVDYQGQQIMTVTAAMNGDQNVSYVVTDDTLLLGPTVDLIKSALDTHAGQKASLADDPFYTQQLATLHADRLATVYYDGGTALAQMPLPTDSTLPASCMQGYEAAAKVKSVGELRAESDHLAFTMRTQPPVGANVPQLPQNKQTPLAQSMPANSVAYVEARSVGANLRWFIQQWLSCMAAAPGSSGPLPSGLGNIGDMSSMFEQFLGTQPENYFDFVADAGVAATFDNGKWGGGLVATVDDESVAKARVDKLTSLVGLLGSFGSSGSPGSAGITTQQVDHNGTKITVVRDASAATSLSIAVANGKLYIGLDDFAAAALDRSAADSLAANAKYQTSLAAGPADNSGIAYVDVPQALAARAAGMSSSDRQQYEQDMKPFLTPLSTLSVISHVDDGLVISNGFLNVE